jgi:high-affinity iron transporter
MSFVSSTLVVLRESFEAFLIVGILFGIVRKLGAPEHRVRIFAGTAAGVAASVVVGILLLSLAAGLRKDYSIWVEFLAAYVAVAVLTYMVVWMYRHTQDLMGGMHAKVKAALDTGALGALFFIPFIAVLREGFETVLFLAADPEAPEGVLLWGALALGVAGAALAGTLLFAGVVRFSVERFFAVTGALLVLFGAWILRYGTHEGGELLERVGSLHEVGEFFAHAGSWVVAGIYLVAVLAWYLRPLLRRKARAAAA